MDSKVICNYIRKTFKLHASSVNSITKLYNISKQYQSKNNITKPFKFVLY